MSLARTLPVAGGAIVAGVVLKRRGTVLFLKFFGLLNRYVQWHQLPLPLALANFLSLRAVLRRENLYDTTHLPAQNAAQADKRTLHVLYGRTSDGSFNDLSVPTMGMAGTRFGRNVPLDDAYPDTGPALMTPSPRTVSQRLMTRESFTPATTLNLLAAAWIQFMTHDWFNHGRPEPADDDLRIPVEQDDPWPDKPMRIPRTPPDPTRLPGDSSGPPTFLNPTSHWWDASGIYGNDDATTQRLRAMEDGRLNIQNGRLPIDPETGISITGFSDNWWLGLALLHTLFTLEHNAICDALRREYPQWSDEQLFQTARLINSGLMAKIHTVEWTPGILSHPALQIGMKANWWGLQSEPVTRLFGRLTDSEAISGIPGSSVDHHGVPFALTEEFASVYRLHPLIPEGIDLRSHATGRLIRPLTMMDMAFAKAETVVDDQVSPMDVYYSFGISHPGAIQLHNYPSFLQDLRLPDGRHLDMASVDIMRDRERGVPRYNQFRQLLHLPAVKSFETLTNNPRWAKELREVYDGDVNRVDLMAGMYAEPLPPGFGFSDTAFRVFILMASRRLKSDRFFTNDFNPTVYTPLGIDWITNTTMGTVLQRHYPELIPALRGVKNAFAPWQRVG